MATTGTATKRESRVVVTLTVVTIAIVSLVSLLAFGYFFVPILVGGLGAYLVYRLIRRMPVRNEMRDMRPTLSDRYGDGQPHERAVEREEAARLLDEEAELDTEREDVASRASRAESERTYDKTGREGPPPYVPFP